MVPCVFSRWVLLLAFSLGLFLGVPTACTLLIDTSPQQCRRDEDCAQFARAVCDLRGHVCFPNPIPGGMAGVAGGGAAGGGAAAGGTGGAPSGRGGAGGTILNALLCRTPEGCGACPQVPGAAILNACTDTTCVPFDNHTRLTNLDARGDLKPLP